MPKYDNSNSAQLPEDDVSQDKIFGHYTTNSIFPARLGDYTHTGKDI